MRLASQDTDIPMSLVCSQVPTQPTKLYERKERYDNESVGAGEVGQWPVNFATLGLLS